MKFINSHGLPALFICLMMGLSLFACAEDDAKHAPDKAKLKECLANAKKFEHMKSESEEEMWANLQKSQDFYLCAEREGDTYAGMKAAGFSDAGVAKVLDKKEIVRLYTNAANADNADAAIMLSKVYCGDAPAVCREPAEAKKWLIKSAALGNSNGMNSLGIFYERGYEGKIDLNKAFACYKLAAEQGSTLATDNLDALPATAKLSQSANCL